MKEQNQLTSREQKLFEVIENLTVALINTFMSDRGIYLKKNEFSTHGYDFIKEENDEKTTIHNDTRMEIKALFEGNIWKDKIGLNFDLDEGFLLLGFDKLKENLK